MQIPDIDAIMHTSDFSCIKATPAGQQPAGPPMFGYNSDPAHEDVPFPDYSYWGHEYTRLRGEPSWCTFLHVRLLIPELTNTLATPLLCVKCSAGWSACQGLLVCLMSLWLGHCGDKGVACCVL